MSKRIELVLTPQEAFDPQSFKDIVSSKVKPGEGSVFRLIKRSIDARSRAVRIRITGEVVPADSFSIYASKRVYPDVSRGKRVVIVGAGPAGLFAAMRLIEAGVKPVVLERGKDVQARRRDIAAINKDHHVDQDSNYCFGEGGAGTYSDGKLYTRSTKRGDVKRILEILVAHGATEDILYDAHPHIGTNKLPILVSKIRETILSAGGEIKFETRVTDFIVNANGISGVKTTKGDFAGEAVILATGHSARDIFTLLHERGIYIESKPFAIGVRVEHAQSMIDQIQYHCDGPRDTFLPASSYSLVHQVNAGGRRRGVFSFCMCPGGFIVPSATMPGEVVVNGMSPSRRDSRFANSGVVVAVEPSDFPGGGPLAGMHFQAEIERRACQSAGGKQGAPAQRLMDFMNGRVSETLLDTSYQPGVCSSDMSTVLPEFIYASLRTAFSSFGTKMKGYLTNDAQMLGVESRTSSPVRVPRGKDFPEHPHVKRLFPCGEGAGYAGGIVSAAMDGDYCAEAVVSAYFG